MPPRSIATSPLQRGRSLTVQLVDPAGKPLTNASAQGLHPQANEGHYSGLDDQSRVEVTGLDSKVPRTVVFLHHGRQLGATLVVQPNDAVEAVRTVTLRPCGIITGRLVDGEGKPATAQVELGVQYGDNASTGGITPGYTVDRDGRFRVELLIPGASHDVRAADRIPPGSRMPRDRFQVFAMAEKLVAQPGQVIDLGTFNVETGQRVNGPEEPARKTDARAAASFREVPITGRVIDLEGHPVAGVKVRVGGVTRAKGGDLTPWLEAVRRGEPPWVAYKLLDDDKSDSKDIKVVVETDKEGRFRLGGIGAECRVGLTIEGPTIAYKKLDVVTRKIEPFQASGFSNLFGPGTETIHGADFTYTASPARIIEGVVRDAKTKEPMADVGVWSYRFAGSTFVGTKDLKTRSDASGRFRVEGMPKGRANELLIVPTDEQPYFMQEFSVPDPAGLGTIAVEVDLHKGIWIEGKVTDKGTGAPVADAWLHYFPFLDNPFAQKTPEFNGGGYSAAFGYQDRYKTRSDGRYRTVGLPGRAILGVIDYSGKPYRQGAGSELIKGMSDHGHFPVYVNPVPPGRLFPTSMKEINPEAKADVVRLDIELDPGARVGLKLVDPEDKPVTNATAIGRVNRGRQEFTALAESGIDVEALAPGEDRTVLIRHEGRKLGRVIHVKPGDDAKGRLVVKLEPSATIAGRITDADGQPVSGATIATYPEPGGDFSPGLPQVASDKEGRFALPNVPIGCSYSLVVESRAANVDTKLRVQAADRGQAG